MVSIVNDLRQGERLWRSLHRIVGSVDSPRIRITRLPDSPAVGSSHPAKNWQVEIVATIPPAPVVTSTASTKGPSW